MKLYFPVCHVNLEITTSLGHTLAKYYEQRLASDIVYTLTCHHCNDYVQGDAIMKRMPSSRSWFHLSNISLKL